MHKDFTERLRHLFQNSSMADIARRINVPHATIRNYFQGRLPAPDVLIKIAGETNVSLNWLLTGKGEMYVSGQRPFDIGQIIDEHIKEVVDKRLAERFSGEIAMDVQDLGRIDAAPPFNVAEAVLRLGDPHRVMNEWFEHEGRNYPQDFALVFFQGWETFSDEEKVEAVLDAKKVLDRTLKNRSKPE